MPRRCRWLLGNRDEPAVEPAGPRKIGAGGSHARRRSHRAGGRAGRCRTTRVGRAGPTARGPPCCDTPARDGRRHRVRDRGWSRWSVALALSCDCGVLCPQRVARGGIHTPVGCSRVGCPWSPSRRAAPGAPARTRSVGCPLVRCHVGVLGGGAHVRLSLLPRRRSRALAVGCSAHPADSERLRHRRRDIRDRDRERRSGRARRALYRKPRQPCEGGGHERRAGHRRARLGILEAKRCRHRGAARGRRDRGGRHRRHAARPECARPVPRRLLDPGNRQTRPDHLARKRSHDRHRARSSRLGEAERVRRVDGDAASCRGAWRPPYVRATRTIQLGAPAPAGSWLAELPQAVPGPIRRAVAVDPEQPAT